MAPGVPGNPITPLAPVMMMVDEQENDSPQCILHSMLTLYRP